jgi:hypothetical protein
MKKAFLWVSILAIILLGVNLLVTGIKMAYKTIAGGHRDIDFFQGVAGALLFLVIAAACALWARKLYVKARGG